MPTALIVLAAGQGTRMESDLPKVLHQIGNRPLFAHALASAAGLNPDREILVVGHGADEVRKAAADFNDAVEIVVQDEALGTGHATAAARQALSDFDGDAIVIFGDTPFVRPETLARVAEARKDHDVVVLGFEPDDPAAYGRLVMNGDRLQHIVEFRDASEDERKITLCNSGILAAEAATLFALIDRLEPSPVKGEYYLTDVVGLAVADGLSAGVVLCDEAETLGINSRAELSSAEAIFQSNARQTAQDNGVNLIAPDTVFFSADTVIGRDATIEPNVVFGPSVTVESGARIRAFSHLEGAHVGRGAIVGPYARLRPGAELANDTRIGNFVEVKNAIIGEGSKVNHLSYIGDAGVGQQTNIGAGTITCNYDGVMKHRTEIGDNVFIGSDTMLVAPVTIGDNAMTATGTVVTKSVPEGALAIARGKQDNKPGLAVKLFEKLKAAKARRQKGT